MSERASGSRSLEKGAIGVLTGLSIVMAIVIMAFSVLAGYLVGKDLASRDNARDNVIAKR